MTPRVATLLLLVRRYRKSLSPHALPAGFFFVENRQPYADYVAPVYLYCKATTASGTLRTTGWARNNAARLGLSRRGEVAVLHESERIAKAHDIASSVCKKSGANFSKFCASQKMVEGLTAPALLCAANHFSLLGATRALRNLQPAPRARQKLGLALFVAEDK